MNTRQQIGPTNGTALVLAIATAVGAMFWCCWPGGGDAPPSQWIVFQDGRVVDAPVVAELAASVPDGSFLIAKFPMAGDPVYVQVTVGRGRPPGPVPIPPGPGPAPPPPAPPGPVLTQAGKDARDAMLGYASDVAAYHAELSAEKFATVSEFFDAAVKRDIAARERYGAKLKAIYKPVLGAGDYPAAGPGLAKEMSAGFQEAGK